MTREFDAVVIGGGPAGTSAAIRLAEVGRSCILLESQVFPRSRPGETLHPGVEPLLRQIGLWEDAETLSVIRSPGVRISSRTGEQLNLYGEDSAGPWRAVNIPRSSLDELLLEHARKIGVAVIQERVRDLIIAAGRVRGVVTSTSRIEANIVIDGTGGRHLVTRLLGLRIEQRSPRLFARYGYVKGTVSIAKDAPYLAFDSTGWTWVARVTRDMTQWTRLDLIPCSDQIRLQKKATRPSSVVAHPAIGRIRGADVTWRIVSQPAGRGYFIAGDAAMVVDPASSDGVIRSLLSGRFAGHLAGLVLSSAMAEESAAEQYASWLRARFTHCVTSLDEAYSIALPGWNRCTTEEAMDY